MPTNKKRINITLPEKIEKVLTLIAKRDGMATATKATELLKQAIEIEEDQAWDEIAMKRDNKNANFIQHKDAWL